MSQEKQLVEYRETLRRTLLELQQTIRDLVAGRRASEADIARAMADLELFAATADAFNDPNFSERIDAVLRRLVEEKVRTDAATERVLQHADAVQRQLRQVTSSSSS